MELEPRVSNSLASLVVDAWHMLSGVIGGTHAEGLSGGVSKRGLEPVKVGEEGDGSGAGGESECAGGGIE